MKSSSLAESDPAAHVTAHSQLVFYDSGDKPNIIKSQYEDMAKHIILSKEQIQRHRHGLDGVGPEIAFRSAKETLVQQKVSDIGKGKGKGKAKRSGKPPGLSQAQVMSMSQPESSPPHHLFNEPDPSALFEDSSSPFVSNNTVLKVYNDHRKRGKKVPDDIQDLYVKMMQADKSLAVEENHPSTVTQLLKGCPVTDRAEKDPMLESTYTADLPKLNAFRLSTFSEIRYVNFSTLNNSKYFGRVLIERVKQVVTFRSLRNSSIFNPSRSSPSLFQSRRSRQFQSSHFLATKANPDKPAGFITFGLCTNSQLQEISYFDDGKCSSSMKAALFKCEGPRMFSLFAQHLNKANDDDLSVFADRNGSFTFSTARSSSAANPSNTTSQDIEDEFYAAPSTSSARSAPPPPPPHPGVDYRIHWGPERVPVRNSTRYFQQGTDGYVTVNNLNVSRVLVEGARADPVWTAEIPARSLCAIHYTASSYMKNGVSNLSLNIAAVQILVKAV
ncbi:hypothetical protein DENSPDRAFT_887282 [Dentipellis sp. KUC8613]|nr:hypothetical protein DENSPDRAFT_887282 [Dentipellis sp. KUC8613]